MNDVNEIINNLTKAGFKVLGNNADFIYLEDPACIVRSFQNFSEYAWIIITFITTLLIFGWGISLIRGGVPNDWKLNIRNLILIFGTLSASGAILNFLFGNDVFSVGCKQVQISVNQVQSILDAKKNNLGSSEQQLYEDIDIYDTGAIYETTDANETAHFELNDDFFEKIE